MSKPRSGEYISQRLHITDKALTSVASLLALSVLPGCTNQQTGAVVAEVTPTGVSKEATIAVTISKPMATATVIPPTATLVFSSETVTPTAPSVATATKVPVTATEVPTATATNIPIVEPTVTTIPKLNIEGVGEVTLVEKVTIDSAVTVFKKAFNIPEAQKLSLTVGKINTVDGKTTDIILTNDGYPLAVKNKEGKWESRSTVAELFSSNGVFFGFTYDMKGNQYRKIVRPSDDLVGESSKIVTPEDTFYQSFIFGNNRVNWTKVNEYLAFVNKYKLISGSPHLYWAGNDHTSQNREELINRATQIVEYCKGSIHSWDINEIFNEEGFPKDPNTLANVRAVIETVRTIDPTAKIVINENGLDWSPKKDQAYFDFVKQLLKEGILQKGDMIGYQGHNGIAYNKTPEQFAAWFVKYADLGLNLRITEADIFDVKSVTNTNEAKKAEIILNYSRAGKILEKKYGRKVIDSIIVWGSTNNSSWLKEIGKSGEYPLLLDDNGSPYISWYLIAKSLFNESFVK